MKKILFLLIQIILAFSLNAQETIHQDTIRYVTTNLNLRTAPNTTSSIITQIPKGTPVTIDEDCDCKWIPVSYNGKIGYVSTKYLSKQKVEYSNRVSGPIKYYTNSRGERVQSPTHYNSAPPGATALCRDGTYSYSRSRRGTCSHHGGVAKWL